MKPDKVTVHCSASKNGSIYTIDQLRKDHLARGFTDVGYHFLIACNGQVDTGRPLNVEGAHVEGHNKGNIGICMVGTDKFTRKQWDALRNTLNNIFMTYQIAPTELYCHNQFDTAIRQGKTCPGFSVNTLLLWYHSHYEKGIEGNLLTSTL